MNRAGPPSRGVALALALAAVALAFNAAVSYRNTRRLRDDVRWVEHTHEVLDALSGLRAESWRAEAAPPAERAAARLAVAAGANRVRALTADNPGQSARAAELAALADSPDGLRRVAAEMAAEEERLLAGRRADTDATFAVAVASDGVAALAGLVAVGLFAHLLRRHLLASRIVADQRERLRATLNSIGDAVVTTDAAGRVAGLNPVAEALTGWPVADAAGRPLGEVFRIVNEDTRAPVESPAERALREGVIVGLANHTLLIARDGTERPIDDSAAPVRGPDGTVTGCVLVFRDISERKAAEDALRRQTDLLRAITDNTSDLIYVKDRDGRLTFANPATLAALGLSAAEALGRTEAERGTDPVEAEAIQAADQRIMATGVPLTLEEPFTGPDGPRLYASAKTPLRDAGGTPVGLIGVSRDVTGLRRAEAELREQSERKSEFLATLAHELRNPLAPLRNGLKILQLAGADAAVAAEARAMMARQLAHMVRLIDDLLDVSRISRGRVELRMTRVDLASVVQQAVEASRPLIDAAGHTLTLELPDEPLTVDGDAARLSQVVSNLLNNAAKYTDPGGRVELSLARVGAEAVIRVRDTGVGLAPEVLERVFEMFAQVDRSLERSQGGLGIGLSLVRSLVEMHGGTVSASSDGPGAGSTFTVRLPLA